SMIAAVADVGSPRVRSGTNTPAAAELFAASGPATPSMAPLPNSSLCLDRRFSMAYERNVGISAPPAGNAPNGNPKTLPRNHGRVARAPSRLLIQRLPLLGGIWAAPLRCRDAT